MNGNPAGKPISVVPGTPEQPAAIAGKQAGEEFQRFEELTSQLMQVPKPEVDQKREHA